ncbi:DHHC palmitoyltransferase-domain-containing protein [Coniella lustricola]|uniref:Palmitoyltransferase n=1 Tax=Coniella lustricola TaxID=2025994 RepID=A0A2T2ZS92_9PEZI|nr:DHHC palmitoyltransferase-domain-containing protein [Coniella lustricola]
MALPHDESRSNTPAGGAGGDDDGIPQYPGRVLSGGPPSIISSRMTDIGTEDGRDYETQAAHRLSHGPSQAGTARSGFTAQKSPGAWPQPMPLRRGFSGKGKRSSLAGSVGGSSISTAGRPVSSASKSHVPSVSSSAFFRPMSSQKLQAQRGATRPPTMSRHVELADNGSEERSGTPQFGANIVRHSITSNTASGRHMTDEPPPSRGTEMTGHGTYDRHTANTRNSVTESMRPLRKKTAEEKGLRVDTDTPYDKAQPAPKTSQSMRSSFMLRNGADSHASNREREGAEKLGSADSSPQFQSHDAEDHPDTAQQPRPMGRNAGRNWEYFTGNTIFCLGGRLQNTKSRPVNVATGAFIVIPCILFFAFSARDLWYDVSPAVPLLYAYLTFVCVSSFFHASVTDPGILPRNLHQNPPADIDEDPLRLAPPSTDWTLIKSAESSTAAMEVPTKYCKTCQIWRPPRTHHCRMCDNCVETADHHCVWLNNCVGRRNYRYFFAFVSSATLLALYLVAASLAQILVHMNRNHMSFGRAIHDDAVPFAMVIYGFLGFLYPAALTGYHMFLMARGETTREFLNSQKFLKKDRFRTFTQPTWYKNWAVVLCRPRPPTYYHFKRRYNTGDQRLATMRIKERRRNARAEKQPEDVELHDIPQRGFQGPTALKNGGSKTA